MAGGSRVLAALCTVHLINDGALLAVSALLPLIRDDLHLQYSQVGLLTGVGLSATIGAQIYMGHLGDRRGAGGLLAVSYLGFGAALLLLTKAADLFGLFAAVAVLRLASAAYHPVGIGWIARRFRGKERESAMGFQSAGGDAGVLLAFATSGLIGLQFGWRAVFFGWAACSVAVSVVLLQQRAEFAAALPTGTGPPRVGEVALRGRYTLPFFFFGGASFNLITTYGPLFIVDGLGLGREGTSVAGLVIAGWLAAGVVAAGAYGRLRARFGRAAMLRTVYLAVAATSVGVVAVPSLPVPAVPALALLFIAMGAALFLTWPALFSSLSEVSSASDHGLMLGIVLGVQLAGGVVFTVLAGYLADWRGIAAPFLLLGVAALGPVFLLVADPQILGRGSVTASTASPAEAAG